MKTNFSILVGNPLDCEYIQRLAFKAGYHWVYEREQTVKFEKETGQLTFKKGEMMRAGLSNFTNPDKVKGVPIYSFPTDALKIHERFNTPEYKIGDYVVLVDKKPGMWNCSGDMNKFLGSIQCLERDVKEEITFNTGDAKGWTFYASDIARHATEEEIKAYKEGGDIYIGEYKVEYKPGFIKVGCAGFPHRVLKSLYNLRESAESNNGTFTIYKEGVEFGTDSHDYCVSNEKLNKIIKKAGIK